MSNGLAEALVRIPEAELMDDIEHAAAYANTDFSEAHDAFVEQFARRFSAFRAGHVLDLGCGPADVTVRFAQHYPDARLTAVDGASAMLQFARERIEAAGLSSRINIEHIYLPDDAILSRPFDALISNSLLHHLADPHILWALAAALPKNTPVWVVDLLRPTDEYMLADLVARYAEGGHPLLIDDFTNSLRAAYRPQEIAEQLRAANLAHLNVEIISDRHVAIWGWR